MTICAPRTVSGAAMKPESTTHRQCSNEIERDRANLRDIEQSTRQTMTANIPRPPSSGRSARQSVPSCPQRILHVYLRDVAGVGGYHEDRVEEKEVVVSQATVGGNGRDFWLRQHLTAKSHHVRGAIIRRQSEPTALVASRARSFILFVLCHTPPPCPSRRHPPVSTPLPAP